MIGYNQRPRTSEVTTLWRYRSSIIIIILLLQLVVSTEYAFKIASVGLYI